MTYEQVKIVNLFIYSTIELFRTVCFKVNDNISSCSQRPSHKNKKTLDLFYHKNIFVRK